MQEPNTERPPPTDPINTEDDDNNEDTASELSETSKAEYRGQQSRIIKQPLNLEKVRGVESKEVTN